MGTCVAVVIGGCACVCLCLCVIVFEEAGACCGWGGREAVCRRALTRARAGRAGLPYMKHLVQVTFHALRL